ncbi:hypothetical protein MZM54_29515 [[Brevibacterium] frigoritolerans]|nr:hypothetical protein [Peribacillus frigoritolerans]
MIEELIRLLDGTIESEPFDKSQEYLFNSNKNKYSLEQGMNLLLKEPTVFLSPVVFIMFTADTRLDITLKDYAAIIMKQAKKKNNQKLFEVAREASEIGRKAGI